MTKVCVYHSRDLDGSCSAAIVDKCWEDVELIGWDYGRPIPWDRLKGKDAILVDVCLQPFEHMETLHQNAKSVTWIDHHVSAMEEYEKSLLSAGKGLEGIREIGKAGCELTWEYFFPNTPMPDTVSLLGRYDVWDNSDLDKWGYLILPYQYGCRFYNLNDPRSNYWHSLLKDDSKIFAEILQAGRTVLKYEQSQNARIARTISFETTFEGFRVIAANRSHASSQFFDAVYDPKKHDIMMPFSMMDNGRWTCSMFTTKDDVDVSVIAKKMGGGGHQKAAGFQSDEPLFFSTGGKPFANLKVR